ncbi:MAG: hypothetical protein JJ971_11310 [Balneolaceae bacterium]|nr:hypothetical protein [Balneolaceae bacterium]MBO6546163.1 hypothetical protein [Balneolaceae bacterium]MBO6648521.1 hypothetical protein [Balneolaceae bacterium]
MASGKHHIGIALDNDSLKVAVIGVHNKKIVLQRLDKYTLIKPIERDTEVGKQNEDIFGELEDSLADDSVFDLDLEASLEEDAINEELEDLKLDEEILGDLGDDIDLELEDLEQGEEDLVDVDMVDEASAPASNEMLLYNILTSIDSKKANLGLNISAGVAIYQILKDVDFNEVKKKDLQIIIDDRLESLHGSPKGDDYYSYGVRDDGALLLCSIDEEPQLIQLVNTTLPLYRGKLTVKEVLPDETLLLGLIRANYELEDGGITCILQFSDLNCRVLFLKGTNLWLVSPIITEGTRSRKFLNTVFSKILFQLDTGEVPNLDRLVICNNSLGEEATSFFQERFPDVEVSDFTFSDEFLDPGEYTNDSLAPFTTAIGTAWSTSGFEKKHLPGISFVPKYVVDRQKIFKLEWHGFLLLFFIMISFPIIDTLRQNASAQIDSLENEISLLDTQINSFSQTVNNYNRISNELAQIQDKLELMNTLSENSITWTTNLDLINRGIDEIGGVWLTSFSVGDELNTLQLQGIARYRNRIPLVAELFAEATLLNVSAAEIRGEEVYTFSYSVEKIVADEAVYTPDNLKGLGDLTGN